MNNARFCIAVPYVRSDFGAYSLAVMLYTLS
ncbi:MAG: hypothetical protein JWP37_433 [Mucilaginibacter sp.]|nr:hypothetical protein [Mucilaginibacter sp.]